MIIYEYITGDVYGNSNSERMLILRLGNHEERENNSQDFVKIILGVCIRRWEFQVKLRR